MISFGVRCIEVVYSSQICSHGLLVWATHSCWLLCGSNCWLEFLLGCPSLEEVVVVKLFRSEVVMIFLYLNQIEFMTLACTVLSRETKKVEVFHIVPTDLESTRIVQLRGGSWRKVSYVSI